MLLSIDPDLAQEQGLKDRESGKGVPGLFEGTAAYYARYRSKYPVAMFDHMVDRFNLGHDIPYSILVAVRAKWRCLSPNDKFRYTQLILK